MRGIEFEVVWSDEDLIEYYVRCANGDFCGATKMYSGHNDLKSAADVLKGFPQHLQDARIIELGAFESNAAGGGIHLQFYCVDSVGHAVTLVKLRNDGCKTIGEPESVCLRIPVQAGAIDSLFSASSFAGCHVRSKGVPRYGGSLDWARRCLANNQINRIKRRQ